MTEGQGRDAEALDRLAKCAIERFKTRLDWEWKARLGLWTVLAAATTFAFNSETWRPSLADCRWIFGAMGFLVFVYGVCFAWAVHMLHAEDIRLYNAYLSKTAELVWGMVPVPNEAQPTSGREKWTIPLSVGQFLVTALFAFALVFAVYSRWSQPAATKQPKANVTIEQDIPSKVFVKSTTK